MVPFGSVTSLAIYGIIVAWIVFLAVWLGLKAKRAKKVGRPRAICAGLSLAFGLASLGYAGVILREAGTDQLALSWLGSPRMGQMEISMIDIDTKRRVQLIEGRGPLAWSPDGAQIAFPGTTWFGNPAISVVRTDGTRKTRLAATSGNVTSLTWSPDGRKIALVSGHGDNYHLYVMNADGTEKQRLTETSGHIAPLAWSPDSTKIAFETFSWHHSEMGSEHSCAVFVVNADGTSKTWLTERSKHKLNESPTWSPDGSKLAFVSSSDDDCGLYVMDADGTRKTLLTDVSRYGPPSVAWAPDGSRIAYTGQREVDVSELAYPVTSSDIYMVNPDGSGKVRLTEGADRDIEGLAWSPDSRRIAFISDRAGQIGLYVINVDTGEEATLTSGDVFCHTLAWSPDSTRIACETVSAGKPRTPSAFTILGPVICGLIAPLAIWLGVKSLREELANLVAIVGIVLSAVPAVLFYVTLAFMGPLAILARF